MADDDLVSQQGTDPELVKIHLLLEERKQRIQEMYEYNKRLDRTIILYLTAIYAAIGLRVTGQIDLSALSKDPQFTMVAFLFIFLNFCIITHGISQSAWTMALAKFVHIGLNNEIRLILKRSKQKPPKYVFDWDNWTTDIKGLAVRSRDFVVALWMFLVLGVSMYSLRLVDVRTFFTQYPLVTVISTSVLVVFHIYVFYLGFLELYLTSKFHQKSESISPPKVWIAIGSMLLSIIVLIFCICCVVK